MACKLDNRQSHVKDKWPLDAPIVFAVSMGMHKKSFGDIVIDEMNTRGWSAMELHRRSGVSYDVIAKLKQRPGSSTSSENGQKLAEALGLDWPQGSANARAHAALEEPTDTLGQSLVPVYDVAASAGHGAVVDAEEHVTNLAFSTQYLREMTSAKGGQLAAIRVKGDSMTPTIQDDDMVVIDMTKTNLDFDGLFVMRVGEALQIKRIGRGARRSSVMVIADNSLYPPVDTERSEIDVVGKVIWYGRKV